LSNQSKLQYLLMQKLRLIQATLKNQSCVVKLVNQSGNALGAKGAI